MTSTEKGYPTDVCVDLMEAGVDVSAVADGMLNAGTVDGKLLTIPMGLTLKGIVVNKTLLANEGLAVPETWEEFLRVLAVLKEKGYTPIQGPSGVIGTLIYNMGMDLLSSDSALYEAVCHGDAEGAAALKGVPSVARETTDERYAALNDVEKVEMKVVSDGSVPAYIGTLLSHAANDLLDGSIASADEAVAAFAARCAESMQSAD